MRSKEYYFHVSYHLLDVVKINSRILFWKMNENNSLTKMLLTKFTGEAAIYLCKIGIKTPNSKRGRPKISEMENRVIAKKHKGPSSEMTVKNRRLNEVSHWPVFIKSRQWRKLPKCALKFLMMWRIFMCKSWQKMLFWISPERNIWNFLFSIAKQFRSNASQSSRVCLIRLEITNFYLQLFI